MYEILKTIILPPASLLTFAVVGLMLWRAGAVMRRLAVAALFLLYLLSTPAVGDGILAALEVIPPMAVDEPWPDGGGAIVILSAEARSTPEYVAPSPGSMTLERLRYGAVVHRATGLPVLVGGGVPSGQFFSLASVMQRSLTEDFQVPVSWVEGLSQDTHENAVRASAILKADGISWVILVTHAWHMPRAKRVFEGAGLTVMAAPTAFTPDRSGRGGNVGEWVREFLPSARAMQNSYLAFHEILGQAFYRMAYPSGPGVLL
ncbi:MAG: YdcF family protein [Alphaproteobacteria bacterium]|nr:YdcF family protein [Alphaproteobacteria bacterium]